MNSHAPAALLKRAFPALEIKVLSYRERGRWAVEVATWLSDSCAPALSWRCENMREDEAVRAAYEAACQHWLQPAAAQQVDRVI